MGTTPSVQTVEGQPQAQEPESAVHKTYEAVKKISAMNNSQEDY